MSRRAVSNQVTRIIVVIVKTGGRLATPSSIFTSALSGLQKLNNGDRGEKLKSNLNPPVFKRSQRKHYPT